MSAPLLARSAGATAPGSSAPLPAWIEAVSAGACTHQDFLRQVQRLEVDDPDVAWEALALLDQQFRLKKISRDSFTSLKARLQENSFGFGSGAHPAPQIEPPPETADPPEPAVPPEAGKQPRVGDVLRGRYRLLDTLRKDALGTVFEAADELKVDVPGVQHRVALRWINHAGQHPGLLQGLYRQQALSHPVIGRIFDIDAEQGALFLTMELATGSSLQQLLQRGGKLAQQTSQAIVHAVADALRHAHSRNVFHGEVNAAHVLITDLGEVRLQGFAIDGAGLASAEGDRRCFAAFAYALLSGLPALFSPAAASGNMRRPTGVTREQWRTLRDTLAGRSPRGSDVLTAFAGGAGQVSRGRVSLLTEVARSPHKVGPSGWVAIAVVMAAVATAVHFIFFAEPAQLTPTTAPATAQTEIAVLNEQEPSSSPEPITPVEAAESTVAAISIPPESPPAASIAPDPRPRIDLPTDFVRVEAGEPVARIWVRRQGRLQSEVNFLWWTETGSAEADRDFRHIAPRLAVIPAGARGVELLVPLVPDTGQELPRTFFVKIDQPGSGATLGARTLLQVAIVPGGPDSFPLVR